MWSRRRAPRGNGWIFGVYIMFAGADLFLVEILRAKDDRFVGPFTIAQVTSLVVFVVGAVLYARLKPAPAAEPGEYLARAG